MNQRQRVKQKLKHIPRYSHHEVTSDGRFRPRKNVLYYQDFCCKGCYFDWGRGFISKHLYKHNCAESNYDGLLKQYWIDANDKYSFTDTD
jgi:hypothetical protein